MGQLLHFEKALDAIEQGLMAGRWQPGERLNLQVVAGELGMSVTPVRDAVNELVSQGLLERVNGRGTCVARPALERLADIWQLRALLEEQAGRWLAQRASDMTLVALMEEAETLDGRTNAMCEEYWGGERGSVFEKLRTEVEIGEMQFHRRFVSSAGSPELLRAWSPCYSLRFLGKVAAGIIDAEVYPREKYEGHRRLMAVIARGDPALAGQATRDHVLDPKERLVNRLYAQREQGISRTTTASETGRHMLEGVLGASQRTSSEGR
jgi:DNA-binding GntR family transcriptional regulator